MTTSTPKILNGIGLTPRQAGPRQPSQQAQGGARDDSVAPEHVPDGGDQREGVPKGSGIDAVKPDLGTPGLGFGPGPEAA